MEGIGKGSGGGERREIGRPWKREREREEERVAEGDGKQEREKKMQKRREVMKYIRRRGRDVSEKRERNRDEEMNDMISRAIIAGVRESRKEKRGKKERQRTTAKQILLQQS